MTTLKCTVSDSINAARNSDTLERLTLTERLLVNYTYTLRDINLRKRATLSKSLCRDSLNTIRQCYCNKISAVLKGTSLYCSQLLAEGDNTLAIYIDIRLYSRHILRRNSTSATCCVPNLVIFQLIANRNIRHHTATIKDNNLSTAGKKYRCKNS